MKHKTLKQMRREKTSAVDYKRRAEVAQLGQRRRT